MSLGNDISRRIIQKRPELKDTLFEHLMENEGMTQEKVSERVGKSRAAIASLKELLSMTSGIVIRGECCGRQRGQPARHDR